MTTLEIKQLVESQLTDCQAEVTGGDRKFRLVVTSPAFIGLSLVQQQQLIYKILDSHIKQGTIHALSIKTHLPESI
jgi:acid stress-induced BolA-like protein IbaG/YrbA